ncbi:MAG: MFS transporter [Proteobacteria bacterium]|nr:MFS transporter [Pseudomonadota bacterium]
MKRPTTQIYPTNTTLASPQAAASRGHPRVVLASSLGALFEFYDFYLYGALAATIGRQFFSALNDTSAFILALLAFAAGFVVRPFGALVFGRLGDLVGRKYTFLITLSIMGGSTFLVGCLPTYASAGVAAPIALVLLRMLQGLALGGEYGGAATYVAEHVAPRRRGYATSWIQATGSIGLLLSLVVILVCRGALGASFDAWGWRIPFLLSAILLAISIHIRLRLRESPVFLDMQRQGTVARAPLREAFGQWRNARLVLAVLFGVTIGQAMVIYTGELYALYFVDISLKIDSVTANTLMALALAIGTPFSLLAGWLADRVGRKRIVLVTTLIAALSIFPVFRGLTHFGNPALERAIVHSPVTVRADPARCHLQFDPIGKTRFRTSCDVAKTFLAHTGIPYSNVAAPTGSVAQVLVGNTVVTSFEGEELALPQFDLEQTVFRGALSGALDAAGYPHQADPREINRGAVLALLTLLVIYVSIVFGPLAAWLVELFPPRIRYSAVSLPFHIGFGWFGGFLPAVAFALVARTGDIYGGLWYPVLAALASVTIGLFAVPETLATDTR